MLLEPYTEPGPAPLLAEFAVPLDCGPCLVSNGRGGGVWTKPSKRSLVRVAPCDIVLKDSWLLSQALHQFGDEIVAPWGDLETSSDPHGLLKSMGWVAPQLLLPPCSKLSLGSGFPTRHVDLACPPGHVLVMERNKGMLGSHQRYVDGKTSFYFHPQHALRLLRVPTS